MFMRRLLVVVGPFLLCLLTCMLFRWLDALVTLSAFFQYMLKGVMLGVCVALILPVAGISVASKGLSGWLFAAAGLMALILIYQYLETTGALHWPALLGIIGVNGQVVLAESTVASFVTVTAALAVRRRK